MENDNAIESSVKTSSSRKLTETHSISVSYRNNKGNEAFAEVVLTIDYRSERFEITPSKGQDRFLFRQATLDTVNMWKAVAQGIEEATKMAETLLKSYRESYQSGRNFTQESFLTKG